MQSAAGATAVVNASGSERWRSIWQNVFPFLVVGALWEIVAWSGVFPVRLFLRLETIATTFYDLTVSGILPKHAAQTVLRLFGGFIVAALIGISAGILMARSRRVEDVLLP